jgi:2-keto-4-pentenoate hydratase/2-oxohepta-3-ene-1,7-dioic acid hydratase in catechol pathway
VHNTQQFACRIGNFSVAGCAPFPALMVGEHAIPVSALHRHAQALNLQLFGTHSIAALIEAWQFNQPTLIQLAKQIEQLGWTGPTLPPEAVVMHSPVSPRQVFCTIGNYRSQLTEAFHDKAPAGTPAAQTDAEAKAFIEQRLKGEPYICAKLPSALTGPMSTFSIAPHTTMADWEVELGVVISKPARHVSVRDAMEYVAGFTVVNDITFRDRVFRADPPGFGTDWLQAKDAPGCLPTGPYLIPAACVAYPGQLHLSLRLNGETMQSESTSDMLFSVCEQIAYLSSRVQLLAGDLICTGSPAGFGAHYGRFISPGDELEASISGFGSQHITCT